MPYGRYLRIHLVVQILVAVGLAATATSCLEVLQADSLNPALALIARLIAVAPSPCAQQFHSAGGLEAATLERSAFSTP